ncbi:DUF3310 domain-containing protein [Corynebacterium variabile]|uniref:DUF3310 domain-containing protein n=1 Tax=Corynebacterium variabile TaxID=1727 RepID=UPI002FE3BDB3
MTDMVNHPPHYTVHPIFSIECHDLARMLTFDAGSAVKYLWRAGRKGEPSEDLHKALWYLDRVDLPCRVMQLWDEKVREQILDDLNAWKARHTGTAPILEDTADAIERLAAGDARSAQILAREALDHLNAGVSA